MASERDHHPSTRGANAGAAARLTLPEGEEHHRLHHQELEHGAVGAEQLTGGEVKEEEGVQGQADGDVVDDARVQVAAGNAEEEGTGMWGR